MGVWGTKHLWDEEGGRSEEGAPAPATPPRLPSHRLPSPPTASPPLPPPPLPSHRRPSSRPRFSIIGGSAGTHTFSTTNSSVAALLVSLFPTLPHTPTDNRCHLQVTNGNGDDKERHGRRWRRAEKPPGLNTECHPRGGMGANRAGGVGRGGVGARHATRSSYPPCVPVSGGGEGRRTMPGPCAAFASCVRKVAQTSKDGLQTGYGTRT